MMRPNANNKKQNASGAVFELKRDGRRHLLMANTKEERRHWIQAIHDAMIGASVTRGDNFLEYQINDWDENGRDNKTNDVPMNTPYTHTMERYIKVRQNLHSAKSKEEYINALSSLNDEGHMTVPVEWIKSQFDKNVANAFVEHDLSCCVEQLWKDLCRDSVEINDQILMGDTYRGPDRILGTLTRQILHFGCSSGDWTVFSPDQITEAQAVSYARDILLSSDRTRSGGDSYYCAENLCLNRDLVVICPTSVEARPLCISINPASVGKGNPTDGMHDVVCGWASIRIPKKQWMRSFLILGRNILHCYAKADPIPHELREKFFMKDAVIDDGSKFDNNMSHSQGESSDKLQFSILTMSKQFRRDFLFDDEASYTFWRTAFEGASQPASQNSFRESINIHEFDIQDMSASFHQSRRYSSAVPKLLSRNNNSSAVDVEINVSAEYKIVTLDPQGVEEDDTWA